MAHWGGIATGATDWDHSNRATPLISNYTGSGPVGVYGCSVGSLYSWSGSVGVNPTSTATGRGIYRTGSGGVFQFTVNTPAGNLGQVLTVTTGQMYVVSNQMQVLDSGGNVIYNYTSSSTSGTRTSQQFTLSLNPATTYTVKWMQTAGTGNIDLESATLANEPYQP